MEDQNFEQAIHELKQKFQAQFEQLQSEINIQKLMYEEKLKAKDEVIENIQHNVHKLEKELKNTSERLQSFTRVLEGRLPELKCCFRLENFQQQVGKKWRSPAMYTHMHGYNFVVDFDLSRCFKGGDQQALMTEIHTVEGQFDEHLKWPLEVEINYEFQNSNQDVLHSSKWTGWLVKPGESRPDLIRPYCMDDVAGISKLLPFLFDNILCFSVTSIIPK